MYALIFQIMGDHRLLIRNLVVKWAGKTHDSRSWKNCEAKLILESQNQFAIAGESGQDIYLIPLPIRREPLKKGKQFFLPGFWINVSYWPLDNFFLSGKLMSRTFCR